MNLEYLDNSKLDEEQKVNKILCVRCLVSFSSSVWQQTAG